MPIATFYTGSPQLLADGTRYDRAAYFCASRVYPLHSRLVLTSRSGRSVRVIVRDRTARGRRNVDCSIAAFRALAGPQYVAIGILSVRVRRVR